MRRAADSPDGPTAGPREAGPPLPPFPPRDPRGHKGTFGTVCVVGGRAAEPRVMLGGPAFTARAALRSGCGLVILAMPSPIAALGLAVAPGATGLALPCDAMGELDAAGAAATLDAHLEGVACLAVGPGLGAGPSAQQMVIRLAASEGRPLVLDADALNCLAETERFDLDFRASAVVTPHPGEFARLAKRLGLEADPIRPDRRGAAAEALAQRLGCVVVLKGAGTVVSDGQRTWTCGAGNAALATAGSGDVLTGVIAGLVAQFHGSRVDVAARLDLFDAARLGVQLHAVAADRWAARHGPAGLLAEDLCDELPDALRVLRGGAE